MIIVIVSRKYILSSSFLPPKSSLSSLDQRLILVNEDRTGVKRNIAFYSKPKYCQAVLGVKVRFLSFNRTQFRAVTGLLTGHNTLRRHLYLLGLLDGPLCRRCGAEEETSSHILCECEDLSSLRHAYLGSFFLEPEDIKNIGLGQSGTLVK